jgi:hypothetical protein
MSESRALGLALIFIAGFFANLSAVSYDQGKSGKLWKRDMDLTVFVPWLTVILCLWFYFIKRKN